MPALPLALSSGQGSDRWNNRMDDGLSSAYRLTRPESPEAWAAYCAIRRLVAFEAGEDASEDPDERAPGHYPLLLTLGSVPIGTIRVDNLDRGDAALRLVAIDPARQGEGHGRVLLREAEGQRTASVVCLVTCTGLPVPSTGSL